MRKLSQAQVTHGIEATCDALREVGVLIFVFGLAERMWSEHHIGSAALTLFLSALPWTLGEALAIMNVRSANGSRSRRHSRRRCQRLGALPHAKDRPASLRNDSDA
jgi:hypothetical protein